LIICQGADCGDQGDLLLTNIAFTGKIDIESGYTEKNHCHFDATPLIPAVFATLKGTNQRIG